MSGFKSYKELKVWQKGIEIVLLTYKFTKNFPLEEQFGLSSQMRRCAVSIPSNIAEGWGRDSQKSFGQFIKIARGSLLELETQVNIAALLSYIDKEEEEEFVKLIIEESKMLNGLVNKIKD